MVFNPTTVEWNGSGTHDEITLTTLYTFFTLYLKALATTLATVHTVCLYLLPRESVIII